MKCHSTGGRPSACRYASVGSVAGVTRQCSRTGCAEPASTTLTYQYGQGQAWLDDLHRDRDPHGYDLCERHADRMRVPTGWQLDDRRRLRLVAITRLAS